MIPDRAPVVQAERGARAGWLWGCAVVACVVMSCDRGASGPPREPAASASAPAASASAPAPSSAPRTGAPMNKLPESIGEAEMLPDGTIKVQLRAEDPESGAIGDALLVYPPNHPQYEMVKKHLDPIRPGEHKFVPPFPDH
jgi:hypothetical protein